MAVGGRWKERGGKTEMLELQAVLGESRNAAQRGNGDALTC